MKPKEIIFGRRMELPVSKRRRNRPFSSPNLQFVDHRLLAPLSPDLNPLYYYW
uniref:Uncharacterized protein n=1 Tax=Lepeophtheirus salmonis TaxID=72036 RepID=A0A0K2U2Z3_LEPSM